MSTLTIRPRFKQVVEGVPETIKARLQAKLDEGDAQCKGVIVTDTLILTIPIVEQHFWSPQLNLSFEAQGTDQTLIRGFYGPKPSIWTIFTLGYAAIGILSFFVLVYGTSQWMLKKDPFSLWFLVILGSMAVGMYLTAQFGQKLGAQQMFTLHHFYEEALGVRVEI